MRTIALAAPLLAALALVSAAPAGAATHTWTGAQDDQWSNPANWTGGKPTSGEADGTVVVFEGGTQSVVDYDVTVDSLVLSGNGNVIEGDSLSTLGLSSAIEEHTIDSTGTGNELRTGLAIEVLPGTFPVIVRSTGGTLQIGASISGVSEASLRFTSLDAAPTPTDGTELTGVNPFAGVMAVQSGVLELGGSGESTTVQATSLATELSGVLRLAQPTQIDDGTEVAALDGGKFELNGQSELIEELIVADGGRADLGSGSLLVTGPVIAVGSGTIDVGSGALGVGGLFTVESSTIAGLVTSRINLGGDVRLVPGADPAIVRPSLTLNDDRAFIVEDGAQGAVITGNVLEGTGAPNALRKVGTGTLRLSNATAPNTYSGGTTVADGALVAESAGMIPAGTVTVGDGVGSAESAVLSVDDVAGIAATANLVVARDGSFRYTRPGTSPALASLAIQGGRATGAATSDLALGALTFTDGVVDGLASVETGAFTGEGSVEVPLSVTGTIEPKATGLRTAALTLAATARLRTVLSGGAASPLIANGPVTIAPGAQLELVRGSGTTPPSTLVPALVLSRAADAITGAFANAPAGGTVALDGQAFGVSYTGGDGGNDFVLAAPAAVAPTPTETPIPEATPSATPIPVVTAAPTPTPSPEPTDVVAPVVSVSASARQRLSKASTITLRARSGETGTATITISVRPPGAKRPVRASSRVELAGGERDVVEVALPSKARTAVRAAVRRGKTVTVTVTVRVADVDGNRSKPATRTIKIVR